MLLSKVEDAQIKLLLLRDDVLSNIESEGKTSTGSGSEAVDERSMSLDVQRRERR